jgi:taurine transport system permease protein
MIPLLLIYVAIFGGSFILIRLALRRLRERHDFTSLKTVTFGDESAVRPDRAASLSTSAASRKISVQTRAPAGSAPD